MNIRPVKSEELKEVSLMWEDMQKEIYKDSECKPNWWILETSNLIDRNDFELYVITESGKLIGFFDLYWFLNSSQGRFEVHSRYVFIKSEHRGKMNKNKIIDFISNLMKKRGATHLILCTIEEKLKSWKKVGFKEKGYILELEVK